MDLTDERKLKVIKEDHQLGMTLHREDIDWLIERLENFDSKVRSCNIAIGHLKKRISDIEGSEY